MITPKIDDRSLSALKKEFEERIPFYVPEYSYDDASNDFGVLLTKVFLNMFLGTVHRMNQVPQKQYIEFMNLVNEKAHAPKPSKGPVVFKSPSSVFLDKGEILEIADDQDRSADFQLSDAIQVVASDLTGFIQVDQSRDYINDLSDHLKNIQLLSFKEKNIQHHEFKLYHQQLNSKHTETLLHLYYSHDGLTKIKSIQWYVGEAPIAVKSMDEDKMTFLLTDLNSDGPLYLQGKCPLGYREPSVIGELCLKTQANAWLQPEVMFSNDIQCITDMFYPFTEILQPYNCFYIASSEVFCKQGSLIKLKGSFLYEDKIFYQEPEPIEYKAVMRKHEFKTIKKTDSYIKRLQWEYWNGLRWQPLSVQGKMNPFDEVSVDLIDYDMSFECPCDMALYNVNGVDSLWIRARIIDLSNSSNPYNTYKVPKFESLALFYECKKEKINDVHIFENHTSTITNELKLYEAIDDCQKAFYMCFDRPLIDGPIHLLFDGFHNEIRSLSWWYDSENLWQPLNIVDETDHFRQTGLITFYGGSDMVLKERFGKRGYWLRVVVEDDVLEPIHLNQLFLNGVWAEQRQLIKKEKLANPKDKKCFTFYTKSKPIAELEVWVDEGDILSENSKALLIKENKYAYQSEHNDFWVKWQEVSDLALSSLEDRHYQVSPNDGMIIFSDGTQCRKPSKKIEANYSVIEGQLGNFNAYSSIKLKNRLIKDIFNPLPMVNGSDGESEAALLSRGMTSVYHRNRGITLWDLTQLTKEFSSNVLKVKCISQKNEKKDHSNGHVLMVVYLKPNENMVFSFDLFKSQFRAYMVSKLPNILNHTGLSIIHADKIFMNVTAEIIVENNSSGEKIVQAIHDLLKSFLNPETGGYNQEGWSIGTYPNYDAIDFLLKEIENVIIVKRLLVEYLKETPHGLIHVEDFSYGVIHSGEHQIKTKYLG